MVHEKEYILKYLKDHKAEFEKKYGVVKLGLFGSYANGSANEDSDIDIFYERDSSKDIDSGLEFLSISDDIAKELNVDKVDFVNLEYMNPIVKHLASKDFIYV
jgi:predicted nucleotidyltransferase